MAKRDGKSRPINHRHVFVGAAGLGLLGSLLGRKIRGARASSAVKDLGRKVVPIESIRRAAHSRPKKSTLAEQISERNEEVLGTLGKGPKPKAAPKKSPATVIDFEAAKKRLEKRGSFWNGFQKAMEDDFYG